jgi:hypothetical protein
LAQSLTLEAPYGPQPDELLIGGAFDLQRQIAFHLQAATLKGLKRTNGLSILQARPFHTDRRLSARNRRLHAAFGEEPTRVCGTYKDKPSKVASAAVREMLQRAVVRNLRAGFVLARQGH